MSLSSTPRVMSRPVKLCWAGWETDTLRLQQAGWQMSVDQDIMNGYMRIALRHEQFGMRGLSRRQRVDYLHEAHPTSWSPAWAMEVWHMGRQLVINEHGPLRFSPIDALPAVCEHQLRSLDDLAHFAAPLVRTQAIVLPEETVDELLGKILERQARAKTDYFRSLVREEGSVVPAHKFHAQIISLRDAS